MCYDSPAFRGDPRDFAPACFCVDGDQARAQGMQTLREAGWNKVLEQVTTGSEVIRVTQVE